MQRRIFHIITMSTYGVGLSGGDRIWIELSRRISKRYKTHIYLWEEGLAICKRERLEGVQYVLWSAKDWAKLGFFINYFARIIIGLLKTSRLKLDNTSEVVVYSASEFWQDSLPALLLKLKYPKIKWVAAWYQTAPNPLKGFSEGERDMKYRLKAFAYWFVQLPIKPIIEKFADLVIVNNEDEKKQFPEMKKKDKILVMFGAVDLEKIKVYKVKYRDLPKIYDGVFQGRFHPQKGVIELINIWQIIVDNKPDAKLAMMGDGPLMKAVKLKVKDAKLKGNIKLMGYLFDGPKKYKVFAQSRVVLHPAFYDSGGMAAAEAMAFGLPAVGFDLRAYQSYYPQGLMKVSIGNFQAFASEVLSLLEEPGYYKKVVKAGEKMLESRWSWDSRVKEFLKYARQTS